jgi:hypothetical protein
MNCREAEHHIFAEQDGPLALAQRTALVEHVGQCPMCRRTRATLASALQAWQGSTRGVTVPDSMRAWHDVRRSLRQGAVPSRVRRQRTLAWIGAPVAAAAAVVFAFLVNTRSTLPRDMARAEFVEVPAENVSTVVFVDDQSGWLVVWASEAGARRG